MAHNDRQQAALARANNMNVTYITANAGGDGDAQIPYDADFVEATSGNANHVLRLPAPKAGHEITITVGSNGCEVRTVAASGQTINNVDADGTNEAAMAANTSAKLEAISSTAWLMRVRTATNTVSSPTPN